jgi:D-alanyl-D-alanine carboxypeptidase (penicillin-binding protein 5/6)
MFIQVDSSVSVQDLLKGVIVDSGNDASVALAEYVAGSEDAFANLMNQEAQRLGMKDSHFTDCNGLPDPNHYSSARDLGILARHLINDFPEYYPWYSDKTFTYNNITQSNRNRLLWRFPYADGLKTGHTDDAGFCLVASAKKDGQRLISVVLKEPSDGARADDSISLLTYGFRFFKTYKLYSAGETVTDARVWDGAEKHVAAGVLQNVYVTLPIGQYEKLKATSQLDSPIKAPIVKGQSLGHLALMLDDKDMMQIPLVALQDNPRGSFWDRITDRIGMSLGKLFNKSKEGVASIADKASDEVSSVTNKASTAISPVNENEKTSAQLTNVPDTTTKPTD